MSLCSCMRRHARAHFITLHFKSNHTNLFGASFSGNFCESPLLSAKVLLCWYYAMKHNVTSLKSTTDLYNSLGIFFLLLSILFLMYANKVFAVLITDTHRADIFIELSILMHRSGFCFAFPELVTVHSNPSGELFKLIPFVCIALHLSTSNFICPWCWITSSSHTWSSRY